MLSQGKLKKMPLPYDEIMTALSDVTALASRLPGQLLDNVSGVPETLVQVA